MKPALTSEQYRILLKRITNALEKAKYTPTTVGGWDGPELAAKEVLRPYVLNQGDGHA